MSKTFWILALLTALPYPAFAGQPLANIDSVAIDAGHGDEDGGHKGDSFEKTQCSMVAQALKEIIERENGGSVKVTLTFKADAATNQREKAFAANSAGAKVFVSIHGYPAIQREAGVFFPLNLDDPPTSWKNSGAKVVSKSALLGEKILASMESANPAKKFFLGHAPLVMFYGVTMPAIAVEAVALDGQTPLSIDTANNLAQAIYYGLVEYGKIP